MVMKKLIIFIAFCCALEIAHGQYPSLWIADVYVTPENQDSIVSDYIEGTVRYDSASRTLILLDATIYRCDDPSDTYDDDSRGRTVSLEAHGGQTLNIELIGQNTIYGIKPLTIDGGSFNIIGNGTLVINGIARGIECGLGVDTFRIRRGASVVIDVPYHPADGFEGSAQYQDYGQTVLVVDSSTLIIDADYCIRRIVGFQLNGSRIVSPAEAYYDSENKTLVTTNGPVRDYLEIRPGTVGIPINRSVDCQVWGVAGGVRIDKLSKGQAIKVLNISGQTILDIPVLDSTTFLPLKPGIYIVQIDNYTKKIIVY